MKNRAIIFKHLAYLIILIITMFLFIPSESVSAEITPTDVYYLTKSIDESLMSMYGLTSTFTKKRIKYSSAIFWIPTFVGMTSFRRKPESIITKNI